MDRVFIYWNISNFLQETHPLVEEREKTPGAKNRLRVNFDAVIELARADRLLEKAVVAGAMSLTLRKLCCRMDKNGAKARLFNLDALDEVEYEEPEHYIEMCMLKDGLDYHDDPGTIVLITGDGTGYMEGEGFHAALERLHGRGWRIEVLSWAHSCNEQMREWVEENGIFIKLDDFYETIVFFDPSRPGREFAPARESTPLDLSRRPGCGAPGLAAKPAAGAQPAAARS